MSVNLYPQLSSKTFIVERFFMVSPYPSALDFPGVIPKLLKYFIPPAVYVAVK